MDFTRGAALRVVDHSTFYEEYILYDFIHVVARAPKIYHLYCGHRMYLTSAIPERDIMQVLKALMKGVMIEKYFNPIKQFPRRHAEILAVLRYEAAQRYGKYDSMPGDNARLLAP